MTTEDVDKIVHDHIISHNAYPSPIGYFNFPKSVCASVNETVCHGIPNNRVLTSKDYVNFDSTSYFKGFHGDTSIMCYFKDTHPDIIQLV
jgi:methionyl aminopeptidase